MKQSFTVLIYHIILPGTVIKKDVMDEMWQTNAYKILIRKSKHGGNTWEM
jgi:hypothetical protein